MIALELKTENTSQEMVKAYLEANASETLAQKINNGVTVERDGKKLIMKKALNGFWQYASEQARKQEAAYIDDPTVYGWAIHYFEEDSIEGTLYNEDGTEYKPAPVPVKKSAIPTYTPPAPKPKPQMSIFDDLLKMEQTETPPTMSETDDEETDTNDENNGDETEEAEEETIEESEDKKPEAEQTPIPKHETQGTPFYQFYRKFSAEHPNTLLFMKVGDFYEALGDHAEKIAGILDLTLTGRDCGLDERVPMCGVPHHAFELYVAKLLERGYKVAIAEDLKGYHFAGENNSRIDPETGEVFSAEPQTEQDGDDPMDGFDASAFDKEALCILSDLFGDDIDVR